MCHTIVALGITVLLWLPLGIAHSQAVGDSIGKPSAMARQRHAIGVRYSTFGDTEISLSGRYFLRPQSALHLTVGREIGDGESPSVAAFHERYRPLFRSKHLRYLYGAGLSVAFPKIREERRWRDASPYAGVTLGADYLFNSFPLAIGLDFRQLFRLKQASSTESHNLAVSAHYLFK